MKYDFFPILPSKLLLNFQSAKHSYISLNKFLYKANLIYNIYGNIYYI